MSEKRYGSGRGSEENSGSCSLDPLVRHVSKAIKSTRKIMFWSVIIEDSDIKDRLEKHIAEYGDQKWAMESTIETILSEHQSTMENAVREQCDMATKEALSRLPNSDSATQKP